MKSMQWSAIVVLAFAVALLPLQGEVARATPVMEVSQPVQATDDSHYERGQSIVYDGSDYWLFYGRSDTVTGNFDNGNPDTHDYKVYFKKASSVPDLALAPATLISGVAHNANSYLGETGAAFFGVDVWAFATIDMGASAELYGWYTSDGGTNWTEVGPIVTGLSDGQAHHDEVVFGGELWVVEGSGNFTTTHSSTPKIGGWSAPLVVDSSLAITGGLAHFFVEGSDLYLGAYSNGKNYIYKYNSAADAWDKVDEIAPPERYDPTLFKVGSTYVFAQAPWASDGSPGGRQYIIAWSSGGLDGTFFDSVPTSVTEGKYGTNSWIDMWPIGFTDAGGDTYLLYTSERDQPTAEGTGNIWFLEWDWDPTSDHYAYIQNAIDEATGTTINVAAGTYVEQVEIAQNLTLQGAGSSTVIQSPDTLTKKFTTSTDNYPVVYIHDADNVTIQDLLVDGAGKGNANYRFSGIAFRNAGGTVSTTEVRDVRDTPFSGAQHGVAVYVYNDDAVGRTVDVSGNVITGFQKNGMALNATGTTPLTVTVVGNEVTGFGPTDITAQNGIQVWADMGNGTVAGNTVTGIAYDNTAAATKWVATSILNYYADLNITGNTISNAHLGVYNIDGSGQIAGNDIAIEKVGVYAFGIIASDPPVAVPSPFGVGEPGTGGSAGLAALPALAVLAVEVSGNEVAFSGPDNTATYGIEADAGWGTDDLAFTANNNIVSGFEVGIELYACESGCSSGVFASIDAQYNQIVGNTIGMRSNATYLTANATDNWWGSANGPTHASNTFNVGSQGDGVSDNVDFVPWLDAAPPGGTSFAPVTTTDPAGEHASIQAGVDASNPGGSVNAKAGTYTETGQIVIGKDLSLIGAGASTTIIKPSNDTGTSGDARGWFLVNDGFTFNLSNVTLDGAGRKVYQAIRSRGQGSISDCAFTNIKFDESGPHYSGLAIVAFGAPDMNVNVTNCTFSEIGRVGVLYYGAGITDSTFSGNTYTGKGDGDWLDYALDVSAGAQVTITGNTISGNTGVASVDGSTSAGILVTTYYSSDTAVTITENFISDSTVGIAVGYDEFDTSVVTANFNSITGNTTGVDSTAPTVDATGNWWGSDTGPSHALNPGGTGDAAGDNVAYSPWLGIGADASGDPGFQPASPMTYIVAEDVCLSVGCIQQAVNLASAGDTLDVKAGTYNEQVVIDKSLAVDGAGQGVTVVAPSPVTANTTRPGGGSGASAARAGVREGAPLAAPLPMTADAASAGGGSAASAWAGIIVVDGATDVTIQDLTVDGAGNGITSCSTALFGVYWRNASGTLEGSEVRNIELGAGLEGCQGAVGILAESGDGGSTTVTIDGNYVHDVQKNGIVALGSATTAGISGNTVVGWGPTDKIAQNGIQLSFGAAGSITGNEASLHDYTPSTWAATGILVHYAADGVTVSGNQVHDNMEGIFVVNYSTPTMKNVEMSGNTVTDTRDTGVFFLLADDATVSGTTISGGAYGLWIADSNGASVHDSTIEDNDHGIIIDGSSTNASIYVNDILSNSGSSASGIHVECYYGACPSGIEVHFNNIVGNSPVPGAYGVYNDTTNVVNATHNWWGACDGPSGEGPGSGDAVSTFVDYDPWLSGACDYDGDGLTDDAERLIHGTDWQNPDTDGDGCNDGEEVLLPDPALGGLRDPLNAYDFYDVPVPTIANGGEMNNRNRAINMTGDVLAVLEYSGISSSGTTCNSGPDGIPGNADDRCYDSDVDGDGHYDGLAYDRSRGSDAEPPHAWSDAPNGAISITEDVLLVLAQTPHDCRAAP